MRIGILTLPLQSNYGGILQAYALQTVLERQGHQVFVFQREYDAIKHIPFWIYPLVLGKRILRKCFIDSRTPILWEKRKRKELPIIRQNLNQFIFKKIHLRHLKKLQDILPSEVDAIVVGSDQIWRPKYVRKIWKTDIQNAYLNFAKEWEVKRIAYAASFGVDVWEYSRLETEDCKLLVKAFDAISVREDSGAFLCRNYFNVQADVVLDPTLLLSMEDYRNLIEPNNRSTIKNTLYTYILDETPEIVDFVNRVSKEYGLIIHRVVINNKNKLLPVEQRIIPPIGQCLEGFNKSEFVITDSFHGCVFAIIFRKPFIAIGNIKRGLSRFVSLLQMFGMEDHLLVDVSEYNSKSSFSLPDDIDEKLSLLRNASINYLKYSILKD